MPSLPPVTKLVIVPAKSKATKVKSNMSKDSILKDNVNMIGAHSQGKSMSSFGILQVFQSAYPANSITKDVTVIRNAAACTSCIPLDIQYPQITEPIVIVPNVLSEGVKTIPLSLHFAGRFLTR
jgi:hypothetical protein